MIDVFMWKQQIKVLFHQKIRAYLFFFFTKIQMVWQTLSKQCFEKIDCMNVQYTSFKIKLIFIDFKLE